MKILLLDIAWLAGLLEGEGSFGWHQTKRDKGRPIIQLSMTDKDIVERAARLFGTNLCGPYGPYKTQKQPYYATYVLGSKAAGWMMTLYSLLGDRRQVRIKEVLQQWKELPCASC